MKSRTAIRWSLAGAVAVAIGLYVAPEIRDWGRWPLPWERFCTIEQVIDGLPPAGEEQRTSEDEEEIIWNRPAYRLSESLASGGRLTDDQWRRALERCGALSCPRSWWAEEPLRVSMAFPDWLGFAEIRVEPLHSSLAAARIYRSAIPHICAQSWSDQLRWEKDQELGFVTPGEHRIRCAVTIEKENLSPSFIQRLWPGRNDEILWEGELELEVSAFSDLDELVTPVHRPELDEMVRKSIHARIASRRTDDGEQRMVVVTLSPDLTSHPELASMGFWWEARLLGTDGELGEWVSCLSLTGEHVNAWLGPVPPALLDDIDERGALRLCVRDGVSFGFFWFVGRHVRERWKGEVTILLAEALARSE